MRDATPLLLGRIFFVMSQLREIDEGILRRLRDGRYKVGYVEYIYIRSI